MKILIGAFLIRMNFIMCISVKGLNIFLFQIKPQCYLIAHIFQKNRIFFFTLGAFIKMSIPRKSIDIELTDFTSFYDVITGHRIGFRVFTVDSGIYRFRIQIVFWRIVRFCSLRIFRFINDIEFVYFYMLSIIIFCLYLERFNLLCTRFLTGLISNGHPVIATIYKLIWNRCIQKRTLILRSILENIGLDLIYHPVLFIKRTLNDDCTGLCFSSEINVSNLFRIILHQFPAGLIICIQKFIIVCVDKGYFCLIICRSRHSGIKTWDSISLPGIFQIARNKEVSIRVIICRFRSLLLIDHKTLVFSSKCKYLPFNGYFFICGICPHSTKQKCNRR